jgi:GGDEF domain-containing protein
MTPSEIAGPLCRRSADTKSRVEEFIDKLTGLPSWTQFSEALRIEVAASHRTGNPLTVLVVETSDMSEDLRSRMSTLTKVGKLLKLAAGRAGMLSRASGNQFAVLLNDRDIIGGHVMAERLCLALSLQFDADHCSVIGAGVACGPGGNDWSGRELLDLATWRCRHAAGNVCSTGSASWP